MNTRILYIALLLLTAVFPVKAQFGIGVGYTSSIHRVTVSGESETVPADGMAAGVSWETRLYKDFSFRTGLMYGFEWYNESYNYEISLEEYKYSIININERQTEHEITLPVQLGYELEIIPEILSFKAYQVPHCILDCHHPRKYLCSEPSIWHLSKTISKEIQNIPIFHTMKNTDL